jgi:hypothetical protein
MPIKEVTYKSQLTGVIDSFLNDKKQKHAKKVGKGEGDVEFITILEFIDRFKLFPIGLFPVQKFILKLYYNLPLDDTEKVIKITNRYGSEVLNELTEVEYLRYLYDKGRCNIREQDGKERHELILVLGRRSGKSAISAIIASYEAYKLLCRGFPQAYYGLPAGSEIRIFCIANDKDQASIVFSDVQGHAEAIDYFKSSIANSTQTFMKLRTESDRKKFGKDSNKGTIVAAFKSSIAKGLRGRGVILAILDEIAFFLNTGYSSAEQIYRAMNPSLATFSPKDPKSRHTPIGSSDGRMILISSPDAREGFFYTQYELAMSKSRGASDMLVVQAPTWEVNPTISKDFYEKEYYKDPRAFMTEYGAEFSDRVRGWIEEAKDLMDCVDPNLKPRTRGNPREIHFAGVDFGISNDGTSISLTRFNEGKVELAYHEIWYPKVSWREANPHLENPINSYCLTLEQVNRLDMDEIASWFLMLSKLFYIHKGVFDQYAGPVFEQILHKKGLKQFETRNFSTADTSQAFGIFKMLMLNRQLRMYDYPLPVGSESGVRHSPLIQEMLELQATSAGKNIYSIEAPKISGKHDDMSDSYVRSVLLASEYMQLNPDALTISTYKNSYAANKTFYGYQNYHRSRAKLHGVIKERTVPRTMRMR